MRLAWNICDPESYREKTEDIWVYFEGFATYLAGRRSRCAKHFASSPNLGYFILSKVQDNKLIAKVLQTYFVKLVNTSAHPDQK